MPTHAEGPHPSTLAETDRMKREALKQSYADRVRGAEEKGREEVAQAVKKASQEAAAQIGGHARKIAKDYLDQKAKDEAGVIPENSDLMRHLKGQVPRSAGT